MDSINIDLCDFGELSDEASSSVQVSSAKEQSESVINKEPSNFKIIAVQSLAGNENFAQNFLSEINKDLETLEGQNKKTPPKLKMVPIATLKSPTAVKSDNKLDENKKSDRVKDDDDGLPIKRFRIDKMGQTSNYNSPLQQGFKEPQIPITGESESILRPSGSSRRKSRITTRNAEFDEPSLINSVVANAIHEEEVQKARELPQGSKTELELMRNVAFLRVCVNHILMKIGKRSITYDRNNQTLASLIQKYSKS